MVAEVGPVSASRALLAANARRWADAIALRVSRRTYTGEPVTLEDLDALESLAEEWGPWPSARAALVRNAPPSLFLGVVGSYAGPSGSPSALVFIGSHDEPQCVGYTAQAMLLEATARGLDTCWVGGLFSTGVVERLVEVRDGERIYAVSALGQARAEMSAKERLIFRAGHSKTRLPLEEIAPGWAGWPRWARAAVEAARLAPSARNRQPWRFSFAEGHLTLATQGLDMTWVPKRLDCGIAMLHAELGAASEGVRGAWELLEEPQVARFVPDA